MGGVLLFQPKAFYNGMFLLFLYVDISLCRFMLVVTSNLPNVFDTAMTSRIQDAVEFGLPGKPERVRLLMKYYSEYIVLPAIHRTM